MLGAMRFSTLSSTTWLFDGGIIHGHVDMSLYLTQFPGTSPEKIYFGAVGVEKASLDRICVLFKIFIQVQLHFSF